MESSTLAMHKPRDADQWPTHKGKARKAKAAAHARRRRPDLTRPAYTPQPEG